MILRIPLVTQAKRDKGLPDSAVRLLLFLEERLDVIEYRPVKHESLARESGKKVRTVRFAIAHLEARHYIGAGVNDPLAPDEARTTRPTWYRLLWSRDERMFGTGPSVR